MDQPIWGFAIGPGRWCEGGGLRGEIELAKGVQRGTGIGFIRFDVGTQIFGCSG